MKIKINQQYFDMWIDALMSGQYLQTAYILYRSYTKGFCCFGVLCDIDAHTGGTPWEMTGYEQWSKDMHAGTLPPVVREKVFGENTPALASFISTLMNMNDDGESFETIARFIDANTERV